MAVSNRREDVIKSYIDLSKKLGKLASFDQAKRFSLIKTILYHFDKFSNFKEYILEEYPDMKSLEVPAKLQLDDLSDLRIGQEKSKTIKSNSVLISDASTLESIAHFAETVFKGRVKPSKYKKSKKKISRTQTLVLSDLHFGADIRADETGSCDYGLVEEARRFASIIRAAAGYKEQYRDCTALELLFLGDFLENQLHDSRTGAVIAEQVARAIHLLVQGVAYLAQRYNKITVRCSTGNHGRNTARHKDRAIHQKYDSLETIIYYSVKMACSALKNVTFDIPKTPLASYEVYGRRIGYTHGDTVINPGNPGSSVNVKSLENQVNRLNAALPDSQEYAVIVYGHTHTGHLVFLNNGTVLIGNGSLPPPDPYAVSIGVTESVNNGQFIFESIENYPVGDIRFLRTGKQYDKDESLDSIIAPWKNFSE